MNGRFPFIIISSCKARSQNHGIREFKFLFSLRERTREWTEIGYIVFERPGQWRIFWSAQTLMDSDFETECFRKVKSQDL